MSQADRHEFAGTRRAFADAAGWFSETVRQVTQQGDLGRPALGAWSVLDLIGHTSRALLTVEDYLDPGGRLTDGLSTPDYFRLVRGGRADPDEVAERGRAAGRALGADPAAAVDAIVMRVLPLVEGAHPDAGVTTPVGGFSLGAYLPSRVFELAVHTGDLRAATGLEGDAPASVTAAALRVLALLVAEVDATDAPPLLRALTGRSPLPPGYSVL